MAFCSRARARQSGEVKLSEQCKLATLETLCARIMGSLPLICIVATLSNNLIEHDWRKTYVLHLMDGHSPGTPSCIPFSVLLMVKGIDWVGAVICIGLFDMWNAWMGSTRVQV